MTLDTFEKTKSSVLSHIQQVFAEMEEEMAISHQEKYALLEDAFENASDNDELKVAFEQWYHEHDADLDLDMSVDELWSQASGMATEKEDDDDDDFLDSVGGGDIDGFGEEDEEESGGNKSDW
jgi:hypothetical protein